MLRICQRLKISPTEALKLSKLFYHFNPDIFTSLQKAELEFARSDIIYVCLRHKDPNAFLQRVQKQIPELERKFPDKTRDSIIFALIYHPKNPEKYLEGKHKENNEGN
jgi:hypothetical protein